MDKTAADKSTWPDRRRQNCFSVTAMYCRWTAAIQLDQTAKLPTVLEYD
jgi:hypothetical protein